MAKITLNPICPECGQPHPVTVETNDLKDFREGRKQADEAFPYLTPGQRELLITGICDACWEHLFGEED